MTAGLAYMAAALFALRAVRPDPPRCPRCGEDKLLCWDSARRTWFCSVCATTWPAEGKGRPGGRTRP